MNTKQTNHYNPCEYCKGKLKDQNGNIVMTCDTATKPNDIPTPNQAA